MKKGISTIITALGSAAIGVTAGIMGTTKTLRKEIKEKQGFSEKHLEMFLLMNQWVKVKQEGKRLEDYFEKNGYKSIAIYGMSYIGERLFEELKDGNIAVKYGIDKRTDGIYLDIDIVTANDDLEPVDAVIVTPIYFFKEIKAALSGKVDCPIISIEDILYNL